MSNVRDLDRLKEIMVTKNIQTLPINLLVLDIIGSILIGLGVAKYFGNVDVLPEKFQFENYWVVLILVGALLMFPMLLHYIKKITQVK